MTPLYGRKLRGRLFEAPYKKLLPYLDNALPARPRNGHEGPHYDDLDHNEEGEDDGDAAYPEGERYGRAGV